MLDRSFGWFQEKKEEALKRPIRSRMAAYGAIRSMLSSLNDPYTRFLLPDQVGSLHELMFQKHSRVFFLFVL
jgi:C-terminal processing protease CtpA/Prc